MTPTQVPAHLMESSVLLGLKASPRVDEVFGVTGLWGSGGQDIQLCPSRHFPLPPGSWTQFPHLSRAGKWFSGGRGGPWPVSWSL